MHIKDLLGEHSKEIYSAFGVQPTSEQFKIGDMIGISVLTLYQTFGARLFRGNKIIASEKHIVTSSTYFDLYNKQNTLVFCDGEVGEIIAMNDEYATIENVQGEVNQVIDMSWAELKVASFQYNKHTQEEEL